MKPMICRCRSTGETTRIRHYIRFGDGFIPDLQEIMTRINRDIPKILQKTGERLTEINNELKTKIEFLKNNKQEVNQ